MTLDLTPTHNALTNLQAQHAEQIGELEQRITDLQRQLDQCQQPDRPEVTLGVNLAAAHGEPRKWAQLVADHRPLFGDMPNIRVFYGPGQAPTWNTPDLAPLLPADRPFLSAKTITEKTLRAFLDTMPEKWKIPGRPLRITYMHEGEADALKSTNPAEAIKGYLDTYAMMRRVLDDHPNGQHFELWKVLLRYTQAEDTRPGFRGSWPRFAGDQDIPVGMDCYWPGWVKHYWPAEELLRPLLEIYEQTGLRISVPEVGGVPTYTSPRNVVGRQDRDGSGRAAAIRDLIAYARTTPVEFMNWWCGTGNAGDHHLDRYPSNVAAWAEGMAANPT